jgi:hypothetical protein
MKTLRHWLALAVGALAAFMGLFDTLAIGVDTKPYWRCAEWSETTGKVVKARIRWRPASWRVDSFASGKRLVWPITRMRVPEPDIKYRYEVDGREYIGTRARADGAGNARKIVNRLKALRKQKSQDNLPVYYDPDNPSKAVLVRRGAPGVILPMAFSGALGLFGLAAVWLSLWNLATDRPRRRRSKRRRR